MNVRRACKAGVGLQRFAEVVALFVKKPRTPAELRAALDTTNVDQTYRYIDALRGEGLLYIAEWRRPPKGPGRHAPVYAWQPSVAEKPDAPRP